MWVRTTMWDRTIELGLFDHWVITGRPPWGIKHWLDDGLVQVPEKRVWQSIRAAMREVREQDVPSLWHQLFDHAGPVPDSVDALAGELIGEARGSIPSLIVLERLIERGFRFEPLVWNFRPLPPRTETEHYIVLEAVGADQQPVPGLRIELLIADGEIKSAQTDRDGIARVERIQAGRVVIRVLGLDGNRWRPAHGAPARESSRERPSKHLVERGENLSRIARRYGLRSWKSIWEEPENEPLRNKRKSPHMLHPGDALHVPGAPVFEIDRETDATHRIVLESYHFETDLALRLTTEFATRLTPAAFALWGRAVFGEDIPRTAFEQLHGDLRDAALARVTTQLSKRLDGHPAAYDSTQRAILVAEDIVLEARSDRTGYAAMLACVLIEEFGHALDDLLRRHYAAVRGDAPLDEGARFASLLLTEALTTGEPLHVGVLLMDGVGHDIVAESREIAEIVRAVLGPIQQLSDERTESREYADAATGGMADDDERAEVFYFNLLLAGYSILDANALVDLARKLNARWHCTSGPAAIYDASKPGKPSPALERFILSYLLALYQELDRRIREAPLAADGLPDLGEARWTLESGEALWDPSSPLAGLLEDIAPFGSHQEWVARFHKLDPGRKPRETRVRQQALQYAKEARWMPREQSPTFAGYLSGLQQLSGTASGESPPTPVDDALNITDRVVATIDAILQTFAIEIAGSVVLEVAGPLLLLATFVSGLAKADGQQLAAAKAMGVVFAYFAIKAAALKDPPPADVTFEDVEREVRGDRELRALRENRTQWRGASPQSVLDEGERQGIELVLTALRSNLTGEAMRARNAYDRMILETRVASMNESIDERERREEALRAAYPPPWWTHEMRRRTYAELVKAIEAEALAVFHRFRLGPKSGG